MAAVGSKVLVGVGWFHIDCARLLFHKSAGSRLASFPGHSQILSRTRFFFHGCKIKSGSGLGTRLALDQKQNICIYSKWVGIPVRVLAITCSRKGGMSSRVGFVFKSR